MCVCLCLSVWCIHWATHTVGIPSQASSLATQSNLNYDSSLVNFCIFRPSLCLAAARSAPCLWPPLGRRLHGLRIVHLLCLLWVSSLGSACCGARCILQLIARGSGSLVLICPSARHPVWLPRNTRLASVLALHLVCLNTPSNVA